MAKVASILPADIAAVRQLLDEEGTPPRVQVEVWLALWSLNYGPRWALQCMAEAERLADLMEREAAVRSRLAALQASAGAAAVPPTLPPRRCYYWLGPRLGVKSDRLNECILNLAAASLIAHSREQLDALRRGLGLRLCSCCFLLVELDSALRHIEFLVVREAAHADCAVEDLDDLCVDEVATDFDTDKASDFDFVDAHG